MSQAEVLPVPPAWAERALMTAERCAEAWRRVEADPEGFWRSIAERLDGRTRNRGDAR